MVEMQHKTQKNILLGTFLFFPLLLLVLFFVYPLIKLILISFYDYKVTIPRNHFVGMGNYLSLLDDFAVWATLKNNLYYVVNAVIQNIVALYLAIILTSRIRFRGFFKSVLFLPYMLNSATVAFLFMFLLDFDQGPINQFLRFAGFFQAHEGIMFLSDESLVNFTLAGISFWRYLGFTMIIYITGLKSIPLSLYEAAWIDGASKWQTFLYVTLPGIRRIIQLNIFLMISGGLQAYVEPYIITRGGPGTSSETFVLRCIKTFTEFDQYGYAASMAMIMLAMVVLITLMQKVVVRRV